MRLMGQCVAPKDRRREQGPQTSNFHKLNAELSCVFVLVSSSGRRHSYSVDTTLLGLLLADM